MNKGSPSQTDRLIDRAASIPEDGAPSVDQERRSNDRLPYTGPVVLIVLGPEGELASPQLVQGADLSPGGLGVTSRNMIHQGAIGAAQLLRSDGKEAIIGVRVRHCRYVGKMQHKTGLQFIPLPAAFRDAPFTDEEGRPLIRRMVAQQERSRKGQESGKESDRSSRQNTSGTTNDPESQSNLEKDGTMSKSPKITGPTENMRDLMLDMARGAAPKDESLDEHRNTQRHPMDCKVAIVQRTPDGGKSICTILQAKDISPGGMRVISRYMLHVGHEGAILVPRSNGEEVMVGVRVVHCRYAGTIGHESGLEFVGEAKGFELDDFKDHQGNMPNLGGKLAA